MKAMNFNDISNFCAPNTQLFLLARYTYVVNMAPATDSSIIYSSTFSQYQFISICLIKKLCYAVAMSLECEYSC